MTRLSVNINKVALLRNARGRNLPNLIEVAIDCERFGAQGITIHPRPDERHIRYQDAYDLTPVVTTELNIEGYPSKRFLDLLLEVKPRQATLVPDDPGQLTSDHGWDTRKHALFLKETIATLRQAGIRTSLFVDPDPEMVRGAAETGTDRIELYTETYASQYQADRDKAIAPFIAAATVADQLGIGINAGHDLNLENVAYFAQHINNLLEVSIGHALISEALYLGLENVIQMYLRQLAMKPVQL